MRLYKQIREVTIGETLFSFDKIDIDFEVGRTNNSTSNIAAIKIYNLSQDNINGISKGLAVSIEAGYKDFSKVIFNGVVDTVRSYDEDNGVTTEIKATQNNELMLYTRVDMTFNKNSKASEIINALVNNSHLEIGILDLVNDKQYPKGKTFSCSLKKAFQVLAKDTGSKFFYDSTKVYFKNSSKEYTKSMGIDGYRGLLKIEPAEKGFSMQTLMIPEIVEDIIINVTDKYYTGKYRVKECSYTAKGTDDFSIFSVLEVV
ncbi:phage protein [uncultured Ilyobacter sp.]|uniref:phage protein n=1 Tax=uncultured Ilyobacter sp. TaxID=544433 RepID=UPI0029C88B5D|nr:hypothetical protein [uncultured Ilyobacter sp.]